jgi:LAS superfamily LD-carboxypeptidase LdcB
MRVVEPHHLRGVKKPKQRRNIWPIWLLLLLLVAGSGFLWLRRSKPAATTATSSAVATKTLPSPAKSKTGFKTLSGEDFKRIYQQTAYPNIQPITDPPAITGDPAADARIRQLAEARGYHLTSVPAGAIVKINEPRLENDDLLQPLAAISWQELKAAAKQAGLPLTLISAYRSPEYQRQLFMPRLLASGTSVAEIAAGNGDAAVNVTLGLTAVPGYSRHHTGYTVDMWCEDGSGSFLTSSCYHWIAANNYLHAKEHGWIPSYPPGTNQQGPEPEPWEFVWVGTERLR